MAGLYIHIPFCKSRCRYCAFYSTTRIEMMEKYVDAVVREWQMRSGSDGYLGSEEIRTVYIGGGSPSLLPPPLLLRLLGAIDLGNAVEVTVECNPDDISPSLAHALVEGGVNRVSMGAQSFDDDTLRRINRRHDAVRVATSMDILRDAGITNIGIDLIYGFPWQTKEMWAHDLHEAMSLAPQHLSAYNLSIEEGTPMYADLQSGAISQCDEETEREMYEMLMDAASAHGMVHYEISNFAMPGMESRHNSSYWDGTHYMGLGAAAHSYDGVSRQWNVSDMATYINKVEKGEMAMEREELDLYSRYDDMVMLSMRTRRGLDVRLLRARMGDAMADYCVRQAMKYVNSQLLEMSDDHIALTRKGIFVSDMVISDMMWDR